MFNSQRLCPLWWQINQGLNVIRCAERRNIAINFNETFNTPATVWRSTDRRFRLNYSSIGEGTRTFFKTGTSLARWTKWRQLVRVVAKFRRSWWLAIAWFATYCHGVDGTRWHLEQWTFLSFVVWIDKKNSSSIYLRQLARKRRLRWGTISFSKETLFLLCDFNCFGFIYTIEKRSRSTPFRCCLNK